MKIKSAVDWPKTFCDGPGLWLVSLSVARPSPQLPLQDPLSARFFGNTEMFTIIPFCCRYLSSLSLRFLCDDFVLCRSGEMLEMASGDPSDDQSKSFGVMVKMFCINSR